MIVPMSCRETVSCLLDHVERRLGSTRARRLESHLKECPRCREFLASYRATPRIVRRATAVAPDRGVRRRLHAAIRRALRPSGSDTPVGPRRDR
jgi:anti-sigma factor RsiW